MSATAPVTSQPISATLLKFVVSLLSNPATSAAVPAILAALGVSAPPVLLLLLKFGIPLVGDVMSTWKADEITEEQIVSELQKKGYKVVAFDPSTMFKVA